MTFACEARKAISSSRKASQISLIVMRQLLLCVNAGIPLDLRSDARMSAAMTALATIVVKPRKASCQELSKTGDSEDLKVNNCGSLPIS